MSYGFRKWLASLIHNIMVKHSEAPSIGSISGRVVYDELNCRNSSHYCKQHDSYHQRVLLLTDLLPHRIKLGVLPVVKQRLFGVPLHIWRS